MLTIRLIRFGKKRAPLFRIVLVKKTAPAKSRKFLEILGYYNPRRLAKERLAADRQSTEGLEKQGLALKKEINLKKERIKYWLSQGVQVSETVHNLLVDQEIIKKPKIKKKFKVKKKIVKAAKEEVKKEEKEVKEEKDLNKEIKAKPKEKSKKEPEAKKD